MKGYQICYNGKKTDVAIKDDSLIVIDLFCKDDENRMYVESVDYADCKILTWYNHTPINIGDRFEIKVVEMEKSSEPAKVEEDKTIKRPMTKLDYFRFLEERIKNHVPV